MRLIKKMKEKLIAHTQKHTCVHFSKPENAIIATGITDNKTTTMTTGDGYIFVL